MAVMFTYSLPATTHDAISSLEGEFNIRLPDDYRQFLLRQNGGRPQPAVFDFIENGKPTSSTVDIFTGVHSAPFDPTGEIARPLYAALDFKGKYRTFKVREKRMPDELVPIAYDPGGNQICIAVSGDHTGTIYFWDHDNEVIEDEEIDWYRNVHFVANSFSDFLESLHD